MGKNYVREEGEAWNYFRAAITASFY